MALRVNGWVRLWIVISTFWVVAVGYFAYVELGTLTQPRKFEVNKDGVGTFEVHFSSAQTDATVQAYVKDILVPKLTADPSKYVGATITEPFDAHVSELRPRILLRQFFSAIIPPLAVLLLGLSAAWIRRGFHKHHDA